MVHIFAEKTEFLKISFVKTNIFRWFNKSFVKRVEQKTKKLYRKRLNTVNVFKKRKS